MAGTYANLLYHLVFSTKQRLPCLNSSWREELHRYLGGIIKGEGGLPIQIGGVADHVHLLIKLKPTIVIPDLLRQLKANSSKWINATHGGAGKFHWQDGYAIFSVSQSNADIVGKYILSQPEHHREIAYQEELLLLLKKHQVDYDERYLWE
ncbi:MAG: IS200/IS605 family transposase [Pirellulales bacterium]|nr:IS200/IS605 family transposase [Pirellulales bacterium]